MTDPVLLLGPYDLYTFSSMILFYIVGICTCEGTEEYVIFRVCVFIFGTMKLRRYCEIREKDSAEQKKKSDDFSSEHRLHV